LGILLRFVTRECVTKNWRPARSFGCASLSRVCIVDFLEAISNPSAKKPPWWGISCWFMRLERATTFLQTVTIVSAACQFRGVVLSKFRERRKSNAANKHSCGGFASVCCGWVCNKNWVTDAFFPTARNFHKFMQSIYSERPQMHQQRCLIGDGFRVGQRGSNLQRNFGLSEFVLSKFSETRQTHRQRGPSDRGFYVNLSRTSVRQN
jgi:hypothetical protein